MARYSTAEALRQILQDTDSDEDSVSEHDGNSDDGDYLPGAVAESDTEDHVSEESDELTDATTSEEEQVRCFRCVFKLSTGSFSASAIIFGAYILFITN